MVVGPQSVQRHALNPVSYIGVCLLLCSLVLPKFIPLIMSECPAGFQICLRQSFLTTFRNVRVFLCCDANNAISNSVMATYIKHQPHLHFLQEIRTKIELLLLRRKPYFCGRRSINPRLLNVSLPAVADIEKQYRFVVCSCITQIYSTGFYFQ